MLYKERVYVDCLSVSKDKFCREKCGVGYKEISNGIALLERQINQQIAYENQQIAYAKEQESQTKVSRNSAERPEDLVKRADDLIKRFYKAAHAWDQTATNERWYKFLEPFDKEVAALGGVQYLGRVKNNSNTDEWLVYHKQYKILENIMSAATFFKLGNADRLGNQRFQEAVSESYEYLSGKKLLYDTPGR